MEQQTTKLYAELARLSFILSQGGLETRYHDHAQKRLDTLTRDYLPTGGGFSGLLALVDIDSNADREYRITGNYNHIGKDDQPYTIWYSVKVKSSLVHGFTLTVNLIGKYSRQFGGDDAVIAISNAFHNALSSTIPADQA